MRLAHAVFAAIFCASDMADPPPTTAAVPMVVTTSAVVVNEASASVPTATAVATVVPTSSATVVPTASATAVPTISATVVPTSGAGSTTAVVVQAQQQAGRSVSSPGQAAIKSLIKFCLEAREVSSDADEQKALAQLMILVQRAAQERKEVLHDLQRSCYLHWTTFPASYPRGHSVTPQMLRIVRIQPVAGRPFFAFSSFLLPSSSFRIALLWFAVYIASAHVHSHH